MTSSDSSTNNEAQQRIVDRAMNDPDFRARLVQYPREAVQEELGTSLSTGTIRVIEEQPGEVVLVLPARAAGSGSGLSDEDLEQAAGGATAYTAACGQCDPSGF